MMKFTSLCLSLFLLTNTPLTLGHHGNTEYNLSEQTRYEGVVTEVSWRNPHVFITLETQTTEGEFISLEIEGGAPAVLRTSGISAESLVPGDRVVAVVSPSRRFPKKSAYGYEIVREDGNIVPLISARTGAQRITEAATDIYGTWVADNAFGPLVQSRGSWALTEKGQERYDNYSPSMTPQARCIPASAPWLMAYMVAINFERQGDRIEIRSDWMDAQRTIYLDGRSHPPSDERFQQGHSVGHFENGELIVDTTNYSDQVFGEMANGGGKHTVERFAVAGDGRSMSYSWMLEDPEFMAEPVSGTFTYSYRPDLELSGMACDIESAERFLHEFE
jgi:hypothetical protein